MEALGLHEWGNDLAALTPLSTVFWSAQTSGDASPATSIEWLTGLQLTEPDWARTDFSEVLRPVCEALDLLSLIARANRRARKREIVKVWPMTKSDWFDPHQPERTPFEIGLDVDVSTTAQLAVLMERILDLERPRDNYTDARSKLLALSTPVDAHQDHIRIPIRVRLAPKSHEELACLLLQLVQVANAKPITGLSFVQEIWSTSRLEVLVTEVFVLESMHMFPRHVRLLSMLASSGVRVHNIPGIDPFFDRRIKMAGSEWQIDWANTLRSLFVETSGVESLTLVDQSSDIYLALISDAQVCTSLRKLRIACQEHANIGMIDEDMELMWRLIGYSFFGNHAGCSVERVEWDLSHCRRAYVNAMRGELAAPGPAASIFAVF